MEKRRTEIIQVSRTAGYMACSIIPHFQPAITAKIKNGSIQIIQKMLDRSAETISVHFFQKQKNILLCKKVRWKGNSSKITGGKIETVVLSSIGDLMI